MKTAPYFSVLMALYFCLLFSGCGQRANEVNSARVVGIADGDTFTLLFEGNRNVKVRLFGIDSPEKAQPYGAAARRHLGKLVEGHRVRLEEKDRDRYGRVVGIAYRDDGLNINETMIRDGYAWHYRAYDKKNSAWTMLEEEARRQRKGLWSDSNPTPPWDWRKQKRKKGAAES